MICLLSQTRSNAQPNWSTTVTHLNHSPRRVPSVCSSWAVTNSGPLLTKIPEAPPKLLVIGRTWRERIERLAQRGRWPLVLPVESPLDFLRRARCEHDRGAGALGRSLRRDEGVHHASDQGLLPRRHVQGLLRQVPALRISHPLDEISPKVCLHTPGVHNVRCDGKSILLSPPIELIDHEDVCQLGLRVCRTRGVIRGLLIPHQVPQLSVAQGTVCQVCTRTEGDDARGAA
mmetsp:Transcript_89397/g.261338  ORF Transcript_89397/g.261338 Transcript_89397/m.261338 type:complete len:231 (+) Transcript_89397:463-1155(+)